MPCFDFNFNEIFCKCFCGEGLPAFKAGRLYNAEFILALMKWSD